MGNNNEWSRPPFARQSRGPPMRHYPHYQHCEARELLAIDLLSKATYFTNSSRVQDGEYFSGDHNTSLCVLISFRCLWNKKSISNITDCAAFMHYRPIRRA